jgi:hypothetical protein
MAGYARVVTFEADDAAIDAVLKEIESADGPPPGVDAKTISVLADRANGKLVIGTRFETEEAMEAADAVFDAMSPPEAGGMRRVSVDKFEILLIRSA